MPVQTIESRYRVTGMDCAGCGRKIDTAMRRLAGVEEVSVSVSSGVLKVQHGGAVGDDVVLQQLRNLGYEGEADTPAADVEVHAHLHGAPGDADRPWWATGKARLTAACGIALLLAYGLGSRHRGAS